MERDVHYGADGHYEGTTYDLGDGHREVYDAEGHKTHDIYEREGGYAKYDIYGHEVESGVERSDRQVDWYEAGTNSMTGQDWEQEAGHTVHYDDSGEYDGESFRE